MKAQKKKIKNSPQAPPVVQEVKKEEIKGKVPYVIEQQKDMRTVVAKKGKLSPKRGYIDARIEGIKRRYYADHIIRETQGKRVRDYVRFNAYYSEAYDKDGNITYNPALENQLMNEMESQLGKAVGAAVGFVLERPMLYLLAIAFLVSIPIGFSYNDIFNWVPRTVVHWVPRA